MWSFTIFISVHFFSLQRHLKASRINLKETKNFDSTVISGIYYVMQFLWFCHTTICLRFFLTTYNLYVLLYKKYIFETKVNKKSLFNSEWRQIDKYIFIGNVNVKYINFNKIIVIYGNANSDYIQPSGGPCPSFVKYSQWIGDLTESSKGHSTVL